MASGPERVRLRVGDVIARLLPLGSRPRGNERARAFKSWSAWTHCPRWPPDLFAVAASLVGRSDCYAHLRQGTAPCFSFDETYRSQVTGLGRQWARDLEPPAPLQAIWEALLQAADAVVEPTGSRTAGIPSWSEAALRLMAIADEASFAMGFVADPGNEQARFSHLVLAEAHASLKRTRAGERALKHLPSSVCWLVPLEECCVLPKTRTPQVGVTLASLSHYLALLPPASSVYPRWIVNPREWAAAPDRAFNLLLIPFPYQVEGGCFEAAPAPDPPGARFFRVEQRWIPRNRPSAGPEFAGFVRALIADAERHVGTVHGVVLPELSLTDALYKALERALAQGRKAEVLVAGVARRVGDRSFNEVRSSFFADGRPVLKLSQSKHHRWKLDRDQIGRYHLGHALHPDTSWWEDIDVSRRGCTFYVFRPGATLAFLVCEDLARLEPVQPVVRAVGPNLLIALLMDGPQWEKRWPGRYATVLAEDPGSSILTLTSLGMLERSFMPGEPHTREIALWKEPSGAAKELKLPANAHALVVSLSLSWEETRTFDGRSDRRGEEGREEGTSVRVALGGVNAVTEATGKVPRWIRAGG